MASSGSKCSSFNATVILQGSGDCVLSKWNMDPVQKTISIQNLVDSSLLTGIFICIYDTSFFFVFFSIIFTHIKKVLITIDSGGVS